MNYLKFDLKGFKLQSGVTLNLKLAYQTYGVLSNTKDNVILFPTFFAGTHIHNEWLIGKGKALDPEKYFIIVPNLFGNGLSSSPSNTTGKYSGIDLPQLSVYDNVKAQQILLKKQFGITKIKLALGWSLGAVQVYFWAALFPDMIEKMATFGVSSGLSDRFKLITKAAISAIKTDEAWMNGYYDVQPEKGIRLMANVYCPWAYSHSYFKKALYISSSTTLTLEDFMNKNWERVFLQFDANDLIYMLETGRTGDLAKHPDFGGNVEKALSNIRAKALLMPCTSDLMFPAEDIEEEANYLSDVSVVHIPSIWGHSSGIGLNKSDNDFIDRQLKRFLLSGIPSL